MSRAAALTHLAERLAALDLHDGRAHEIDSKACISELEKAMREIDTRVAEIDARKRHLSDPDARRFNAADRAAREYLHGEELSAHNELEDLQAERDGLRLALEGLRRRYRDATEAARYPGGPLRQDLRDLGCEFWDLIRPEVERVCAELGEMTALLNAVKIPMQNGQIERTHGALADALSHLADQRLVERFVDTPADITVALLRGREALELCSFRVPPSAQASAVSLDTARIAHAAFERGRNSTTH